MPSFNERLKYAMNLKGFTQSDLCYKTDIPKSAMSQYISGAFKPKDKRTYLLAKALNVNEAWLMGYDVPMEREALNLREPEIATDTVTFPVIGEIAAGYNEIAIEDWTGETVEIPVTYMKGRKKEDFFVLSVKGDSMYPMYLNGDKVLILKQSTLNNSGDIGAILYDGDTATLKKVEYVNGEDWLRLVPINPEYQPKKIEGADLEQCRVIGIPKLLIRELGEY